MPTVVWLINIDNLLRLKERGDDVPTRTAANGDRTSPEKFETEQHLR